MPETLPILRTKMIDIPVGTITLRDDRTKENWVVKLKPYQIACTPVTQEIYAALTGNSPSQHTDPQCPVESVSWLEAVHFCNLLSKAEGFLPSYIVDQDNATALPDSNGYRLPSEAEWEYACRAGTQTPRYGDLDDIAWYAGNSGKHLHAVAQKQPNAWGLYDMLGNVWEWCADQYDPEVYGTYRIFRGGGWADFERGILATNRRRSHPTFQIDDLGFRLARSI